MIRVDAILTDIEAAALRAVRSAATHLQVPLESPQVRDVAGAALALVLPLDRLIGATAEAVVVDVAVDVLADALDELLERVVARAVVDEAIPAATIEVIDRRAKLAVRLRHRLAVRS